MADPTVSEVKEAIELGAEIAGWVIKAVAAFVNGDDNARHLVDVLPAKMKADVEHARQKAELRKQLAEKLHEG